MSEGASMNNLDAIIPVALPIIINTVEIEIGRYFEHCYDGIRSVAYKVKYDKYSNTLECLFRWGDFSSRYTIRIRDVMDVHTQDMAIERMLKEVSSGFVGMAVKKQNEVAYAPFV